MNIWFMVAIGIILLVFVAMYTLDDLTKDEKTVMLSFALLFAFVLIVVKNAKTGLAPADLSPQAEKIWLLRNKAPEEILCAQASVQDAWLLNYKEEVAQKQHLTGFEKVGNTLFALLVLTILAVFYMADKDKLEESDKKFLKKIIKFSLCVSLYWASLYAGLKLTFLPYIKKEKAEEKIPRTVKC